MGDDKKKALERLVEELGEFLDSGLVSGLDDERDPPDRDCVRKGGPVHLAVEAVQAFYSGALPAPIPRNAWRRLTLSRDTVTDPNEWQDIAHETAEIVQQWAEREAAAIPTKEPLNATQRDALEIIQSEGPILGKHLAKRLGIELSTLRKHVLPAIRKLGVTNDRKRGGYLYEKPQK